MTGVHPENDWFSEFRKEKIPASQIYRSTQATRATNSEEPLKTVNYADKTHVACRPSKRATHPDDEQSQQNRGLQRDVAPVASVASKID